MTLPPRFIEMPAAPVTASPVPELTSVHGVKPRGPYGNSRHRGNCGGYLIRDLLRYFVERGARRVRVIGRERHQYDGQSR